MGVVTIKHRGNFNNIDRFLKTAQKAKFREMLIGYAKEGVAALSSATPKDSGNTADSWGYVLNIRKKSISLNFTNDNINDGVSIAILIQYGHATRDGGYVKGRDYINPVIQPIFDRIANDIWREVNVQWQ